MKIMSLVCSLLLLVSIASVASTASAQSKEPSKVKRLSKPVEVKDGYEVFGKPITNADAPMTLADAIKNAASLKGKEVKLTGTVTEVCQNKGCWMMLTDKGDNATAARITFEGYSFFVPTNSASKTVTLVGKLEEKTLTEEEAKHYAEDKQPGSGASIKGAQKEYSVVATSVKIPVK